MSVITIKKQSQLEGQKRIDAEYYQPEYSEIRCKLDKLKTKSINELSISVVSFGAYSLCNYIVWEKSGIPYLNVENIREGYIDWEGVKYIDENVNEILNKSQIREGQVILTMAGTIGNAAVAYKLPLKLNSNQATAKITLKSNISPFFVAAFLNSYYGKKQTEWEIVSSVQPNIFLWQIKNIKVPIVKKELENEIENIYKKGLDTLELSKSLYTQAESLLLEELGLKYFEPKYDPFYSTRLSDVSRDNRIDAEYFQPIYKEIVNYLKSKFETKNLISLANRIKIKITPFSKIKYRYLEISDITTEIGEVNYTERLGDELPPNARIPLMGGELLISKVRPTRRAIAIIPEDFRNNTICSSAFSVFNITSPIKEYVFLYLRSIIGSLQLERPTTGTEYPTLKDKNIEEIIIPILSNEKQQKISLLIKKSSKARINAKQLLKKAVKKVEIEIQKAFLINTNFK